MNKTYLIGTTVLLGSALIAGATAFASGDGDRDRGVPSFPSEPYKEKVDVVYAQCYQLEEPYTHTYRADRPRYTSGWLMVLSTRPDLLFPRQVREPVLYVGNQTAERMNIGDESGKLVVLVPGDDLLVDAPVFFGEPALPEEIHRDDIAVAVAKARDADVVGLTADQLATVVVPEVLDLKDDYELRLEAIKLVEKYSPQEQDLIRGARVPRVR